MTKPARKEPVRADVGTKERRAKGDIGIVGLGKSDKRAKAISKLEAMRLRGVINDVQLAAGVRYQIHHYHAGLSESPKGLAFDSMGGGGALPAYMTPQSEHASHHRAMIREAMPLIHGEGISLFLAFIIGDCSLESCAEYLGPMRRQAKLAKATQIIVHKLDVLAQHWGLTPEPKTV